MKDDDEFFDDELDEEEQKSSGSTLKTIYYENKKLIWILIIVILLLILMALFGKSSSSNNNNNKITNITMSQETLTISVNDTNHLDAKVSNDNNPVIIWTSGNSSVASVDANGNIKGVGEGTTIITANYKDKDEKVYTSTCTITVVSGNTGVTLTSINFKEGSILMNPNSTYNLVYEKTPYNGMVTSTTYSSTNESVVKVSEDGELTAVNIGTSTIRVTVNTGLSASINVYVIDKQVTPNIYVIPTSLAFTDESYEIEVGDNKKLSYTAIPNSATSNYIEFTSNNSNVATVDNSGFVKGISAGDAVITISCGGVSATTTVHVKNKVIDVTGIQVQENTVNINVGGTHQIVATVLPSDATNREIEYTSSNPTILAVTPTGLVTGISEGNAYVTVTSKENTRKAVNVFYKVGGSGNNGGNGSGGNGGSGGSGGSGGNGGSSGALTVKITSNNNAVQTSYTNALNEVRKTYPTITITPSDKYSYIRYCTYTYGVSDTCTPNINYDGPFELRRTGVTVIKAQATYNGNPGEVLTRYVNVQLDTPSNTVSCYCNPSNGTCTYGAQTSYYNTDVNLTETYCKDYINRGNKGCFLNNGNYVWGSYLGKSTTHVYMSSRTNEASCTGSSNGSGTITPTYPTNPSSGTEIIPTGTIHVNWGKSYGYSLFLDSVRILQFDVSSTAKLNKVYFCESSNSTKCVIDMNNATRVTSHYDLRVLSGHVFDTNSTYNRTFYFDEYSGTNFKFYITTEKGHSVTLLATDVNNQISETFSTTA